jgi:hypothetical protein
MEVVGKDRVEGTADTLEGRVRLGLLRENVFSSVIEMLHTDRENRGKLENNRERTFAIHDGHVLSMDGMSTMQTLCANGARSAALEAEKDPRMIPVAERTAADERNAAAVDQLPVGRARFGFSNYLKEAMQRYGTKFYDDLGNRESLGFIQWYYRVDEHTMIAASYSVDHCDIDTVRAMWQQFGGHIPEGLETPTWLDSPSSWSAPSTRLVRWLAICGKIFTIGVDYRTSNTIRLTIFDPQQSSGRRDVRVVP